MRDKRIVLQPTIFKISLFGKFDLFNKTWYYIHLASMKESRNGIQKKKTYNVNALELIVIILATLCILVNVYYVKSLNTRVDSPCI